MNTLSLRGAIVAAFAMLATLLIAPLTTHALGAQAAGLYHDHDAADPAAQNEGSEMLSCVQTQANKVTMTAPEGGVTKDVPVVIGGLCLIPETTEEAGALFAGFLTGVFNLPKATGGSNDFAAGEVVEWDASEDVCIPNGGAADDFDLGYALEAVGTSATHVVVVKVLATTTVNVGG